MVLPELREEEAHVTLAVRVYFFFFFFFEIRFPNAS